MSIEGIQRYAAEKKIGEIEATQVFLQALVLKHLSLPGAHFMGGTALVLGYGNPRFSEDVDLTSVKDPLKLSQNLENAVREASQYLGTKISLKPPRQGKRTWKIIYPLSRSQSIRLHIDTQPYVAHTSKPIVIEFPSLSSFVCEALALQEILSEKIMALAFRKYLGGRDLFDLWFHWLRRFDWKLQEGEIFRLVKLKLKERRFSKTQFDQNLSQRLKIGPSLKRAKDEWRRYLPPDFQKESIFEDILNSNRKLMKWIENGAN